MRILTPHGTVNYDRDTDSAVEWSIDSSQLLELDPILHNKQDVYIADSTVHIE